MNITVITMSFLATLNKRNQHPNRPVTPEWRKSSSENLNSCIKHSYNFQKEAARHLKEGADINYQEEFYGNTCLHWALARHSIAKIKFLLANNADPEIKDYNGRTAIFIASEYGKEFADQLIPHIKNPNIQTKAGQTYLHAVDINDLETIEILLNKNVNPNIQDIWGKTILHSAAYNTNHKLTELLLKHNAEPNIQCERNKQTPLHNVAASTASKEDKYNAAITAAWLLIHGADKNIVDHRGQTALDIAKQHPENLVQDVLNLSETQLRILAVS